MVPAERAIRDAKLAVEALGADVHRLHLFAHHGSIPILKSVREGRTALLAELGAGSILVLAPENTAYCALPAARSPGHVGQVARA